MYGLYRTTIQPKSHFSRKFLHLKFIPSLMRMLFVAGDTVDRPMAELCSLLPFVIDCLQGSIAPNISFNWLHGPGSIDPLIENKVLASAFFSDLCFVERGAKVPSKGCGKCLSKPPFHRGGPNIVLLVCCAYHRFNLAKKIRASCEEEQLFLSSSFNATSNVVECLLRRAKLVMTGSVNARGHSHVALLQRHLG